jgi:hypothetical protein
MRSLDAQFSGLAGERKAPGAGKDAQPVKIRWSIPPI